MPPPPPPTTTNQASRKRPSSSTEPTSHVVVGAATMAADISDSIVCKEASANGGLGSSSKRPRYPTSDSVPDTAAAYAAAAAVVSPTAVAVEGCGCAVGAAAAPAKTQDMGMQDDDGGMVSGATATVESMPNDCANDQSTATAEVAAHRLEAQIDDLTSDMGHWCLTDLKGWRRRRAAVAVATATSTDTGTDTAGTPNEKMSSSRTMNGGSTQANRGNMASPSPTKKKGQGLSPSKAKEVPYSPSEREFLRQRRREARRSMLRGVATATGSSGTSVRRKLDL